MQGYINIKNQYWHDVSPPPTRLLARPRCPSPRTPGMIHPILTLVILPISPPSVSACRPSSQKPSGYNYKYPYTPPSSISPSVPLISSAQYWLR